MPIYFRGDNRGFREILDEKGTGFKRSRWYLLAQKEYLPFLSKNAISLSTELASAAAFPIHAQIKISYIYFVRDRHDKFYNLYGESLKKCVLNPHLITRYVWANEFVATDNISCKDIIGGIKIVRNFDSKQVVPGSASSLVSFQIVEYHHNTQLSPKELSTPEKLLIKQVKQYITDKTILESNVPRKSQSDLIDATNEMFQILKEKIVPSSQEMFYAAAKAKALGRQRLCQQEMRAVLGKFFVKFASYTGCCSLLFSLWCESRAARPVRAFFTKHHLRSEQDIADLSLEEAEKLFLSLYTKCREDHLTTLMDKELVQELVNISDHYNKLSEFVSPQLT